MKNLTLTGIILLLISALLFYFTTNFELEEIKLSHFMGVMAGIGIGLIIGGIIGYISKGSAVKAEQKKKEIDKKLSSLMSPVTPHVCLWWSRCAASRSRCRASRWPAG